MFVLIRAPMAIIGQSLFREGREGWDGQVWWDFFCVFQRNSIWTRSICSSATVDVGRKVTAPKSKLLLSYLYKQFIAPQNAPKRQVAYTRFLKSFGTIFFCQRLVVNTLIWLLLSSQLGSLCHFHTDWRVIQAARRRLMDCPKRRRPFGSNEGLISLLLIWSHWAGCVLIWLLGALMAATLWRT